MAKQIKKLNETEHLGCLLVTLSLFSLLVAICICFPVAGKSCYKAVAKLKSSSLRSKRKREGSGRDERKRKRETGRREGKVRSLSDYRN